MVSVSDKWSVSAAENIAVRYTKDSINGFCTSVSCWMRFQSRMLGYNNFVESNQLHFVPDPFLLMYNPSLASTINKTLSPFSIQSQSIDATCS